MGNLQPTKHETTSLVTSDVRILTSKKQSMIKLWDSLHLFRCDWMLLIFFLYPSAATRFPPLLPGNLHLIKFKSVQAKQRKKSTVDLIKIKEREAMFSHIHWLWMCVCHKLARCVNDAELPIWQTSDWDTRREMIFYSWINSVQFIWTVITSSFQETTVRNPTRLPSTMKDG